MKNENNTCCLTTAFKNPISDLNNIQLLKFDKVPTSGQWFIKLGSLFLGPFEHNSTNKDIKDSFFNCVYNIEVEITGNYDNDIKIECVGRSGKQNFKKYKVIFNTLDANINVELLKSGCPEVSVMYHNDKARNNNELSEFFNLKCAKQCYENHGYHGYLVVNCGKECRDIHEKFITRLWNKNKHKFPGIKNEDIVMINKKDIPNSKSMQERKNWKIKDNKIIINKD